MLFLLNNLGCYSGYLPYFLYFISKQLKIVKSNLLRQFFTLCRVEALGLWHQQLSLNIGLGYMDNMSQVNMQDEGRQVWQPCFGFL